MRTSHDDNGCKGEGIATAKERSYFCWRPGVPARWTPGGCSRRSSSKGRYGCERNWLAVLTSNAPSPGKGGGAFERMDPNPTVSRYCLFCRGEKTTIMRCGATQY